MVNLDFIISISQQISSYLIIFLYLIVLPYFCYLSLEHMTNWELNTNKLGYNFRPHLNDLNYVTIFTFIMCILRNESKKYIVNNLPLKYIKNEKVSDVTYNKISTGSFKFIYFIFTSLWGIIILYNSNYIPNTLGSNLDESEYINNLIVNLPYNNIDTFNLKLYYFWNFSYHLSSFLFHCTQTNRKNWHEMNLHHIVTILLITFSYIFGVLKIGHIVMLVHDIPDIFVYLTKVLNELKNTKKILVVSYFIGLIGIFAYLRIFVFIKSIIIPLYLNLEFDEEYYNKSLNYFICLLSILALLHIYWYILIIKLIVTFIINNKAVDKHEEYE